KRSLRPATAARNAMHATRLTWKVLALCGGAALALICDTLAARGQQPVATLGGPVPGEIAPASLPAPLPQVQPVAPMPRVDTPPVSSPRYTLADLVAVAQQYPELAS